MPSHSSQPLVQFLLEIARGRAHRTSLQKTLEDVCVKVERHFRPKHLALLLVEPDTGDLSFHQVLGDKADLLLGRKLRKGKGVGGWVAERREPLLIEDTASDPRFSAQFLTAKTKDSRSIMAVPIRSGDGVFGVLELFDPVSGAAFVRDDLDELTAVGEIIAMVLERAYFFQAMKRMSESDLLTGLPHKRSFDSQMAREIELCKRYGTPSSVLLLTVENLRKLNELHGTKSIDRILLLLTTILKDEVRKVDVSCRIAADVFAVIMPNTEKVPAMDVSRRINARIAQEGASGALPHFTVHVDVRTAQRDDLTPVMGLCEACRLDNTGFRKFRDVEGNLFALATEEKQVTERRTYYRKQVQLPGEFEDPETGEAGEFLVENLALNGLRFSTLLGHRLSRNALIKVRFRLDDSRRTEMARMARIRYISERVVGCQFTDQKNYDGELGFYLMK